MGSGSWRRDAFEVVQIPAESLDHESEPLQWNPCFRDCASQIAPMLGANSIYDLPEGNDSFSFPW